jgi:hypothetical protein
MHVRHGPIFGRLDYLEEGLLSHNISDFRLILGKALTDSSTF